MDLAHLIDLANDSGGTLYVMVLLLLTALTVIIERAIYLSNMQHGGADLIAMLKQHSGQASSFQMSDALAKLPQAQLFKIAQHEHARLTREVMDGHLEEVIMHEVPLLDRSLWILDTIVTLAPLLGLFGTIIGMFNAFHVLGDMQNNPIAITGGIAEALIATASGLFIAIIGLVAFNALHQRVRLVMHQLETIKIMLLNRYDALDASSKNGHDDKSAIGLVRTVA
jgi:biopolymer transport protein ExbB